MPTKQNEMQWVLIYPDKDRMPLSFAIDGKWTPYILKLNESLLADELVYRIEEEIEDNEQGNYYDIIYIDKRDPFQFDVDIEFTVIPNPAGCVNPGRSVRIDKIGIEASWNGEELPVKWNKELLAAILEMQVHIPNK